MPEKKPKKARAAGTVRRRRKSAGVSTGLSAPELQSGPHSEEVTSLCRQIEQDCGKVLAIYKEPFGGRWVVMAALPFEIVAVTTSVAGFDDVVSQENG